MTIEFDLTNLEVPEDSEGQNELFLVAFNSGDGALFDRLYREDAISNLSGQPLNGAERTEFIKGFLAQGPTLRSTVLESYVTGDTTLIIVDYDLEMTGPDGTSVRMHGTCTDVLRRGENGKWRMVIDRPVADTDPH